MHLLDSGIRWGYRSASQPLGGARMRSLSKHKHFTNISFLKIKISKLFRQMHSSAINEETLPNHFNISFLSIETCFCNHGCTRINAANGFYYTNLRDRFRNEFYRFSCSYNLHDFTVGIICTIYLFTTRASLGSNLTLLLD